MFCFHPIWQLREFWQDRNERKHIAHLYRPQVSYFLSHQIVKSLTFRMYGKLKFQCTRNCPQNPPYCPGSIQDTFMIYSSISHQHISQCVFLQKPTISRITNLEICKFKNPGSLTGAQYPHPQHLGGPLG